MPIPHWTYVPFSYGEKNVLMRGVSLPSYVCLAVRVSILKQLNMYTSWMFKTPDLHCFFDIAYNENISKLIWILTWYWNGTH